MTFTPHTYRKTILSLATAFWAVSASMSLACQVPVFRYALERWTVDPYELVVASRAGGLSPDEAAAFDFLTEACGSGEVAPNLKVRVDGDAKNGADQSVASLYYPGWMSGTGTEPIWRGALTEENARLIVDSPLRREMAEKILEGQSTIWLLIECGDPARDDAAAVMLEKQLAAAREVLTIPEGVVGRNAPASSAGTSTNPDDILQFEIPLKIDFSLLRVKRSNPDEAIFLKMFLNLEDDLGEWSTQPMAFPVFGRGRVLEPLIGPGINADTILEHSGYLCGACSCQVKDLNPGMDLLMAVNWDGAIDGSEVVVDRGLPPLEGPAALMRVEKAEELPAGDAAPGKVAMEGEMPVLWIGLAAFVLVTGLGTIWVMLR